MPAKKTVKCCRECQTALPEGLKATAVFCGIPCKAKWNNRRKNRGAELYDLFMATRFDRKTVADMKAKGTSVWTEMCRLAEGWAEEDRSDGIKSFEHPQVVIQRLKDGGSIRRGERMYIR